LGEEVVAFFTKVEGEQVATVYVLRLEVVGELPVGVFVAAVVVPALHFKDKLLFQVVNHQVYLAIVAGFGFKMIEAKYCFIPK